MKLQVLGSSSKGNCYLLSNDTEALIIEAGVTLTEVKKALDFDISKVVGCAISHEHLDHAGHVGKYLEAGIDIYSSQGTFSTLGISHHRARVVKSGKAYWIGPFKVAPFLVQHDCAEPFGFLIQHTECGTVLFATDTGYLVYTFPGLNNILIECNYSNDILDKNIRNDRIPKVVRDRVIKDHMELGVLLDILKANDLSQVNKIVLLHLSDGNSDSKLFKDAVEKATGKRVFIAEAGLSIEFNKTPF